MESNHRRLVAIGNFDGVHLGHQALLRRVIEEAQRRGLRPSVLTFDPHPAQVLGRPMPAPLTTLARKQGLILALSPMLEVLVEPFNTQLAALTPEQFVENVLVGRYAVERVIVGHDFRFGKGRSGDLARLAEIGARLGFSAAATELETLDGSVISSSRVRTELAAGDAVEAARLLGRPHSVSSIVIRGAQLGRTLGYPTANFGEVPEMLPATGVYACRVQLEGSDERLHAGVANLGYRPTLDASTKQLRLEVHLFDFQADLYGCRVRLEFIERLRGERAFSGLAELKQQIALDAEAARQRLRAP